MRLLTFIAFMREIRKADPDLERIQSMGLLAVKIGQILALRSDLLSPETCQKLQNLYQAATPIPPEDSLSLIRAHAPPAFHERVIDLEPVPFAAASVGQVHRARLNTGERVVVKVLKQEFEARFRKDLRRMRRWIRIGLTLRPRLKRVGNPDGLLAHIEDYTLRELDLRNELEGRQMLIDEAARIADGFPMPRLAFPEVHPELSSSKVLVMEEVTGPTIEERLADKSLAWDDLLQLFRIHGAFMFGVGTFHGDLHPGNAILREDGTFVFIDTGAISTASERVRAALFGFFFHLAKGNLEGAFEAMLHMADEPVTGARRDRYMADMHELYDGFVGTTVSETSLTQQMMRTVRAAVLAGCAFGEDAFPIIRSLMYMDGMVLRGHPEVDLISSMGPYLDEFSAIVPDALPSHVRKSVRKETAVYTTGEAVPTP